MKISWVCELCNAEAAVYCSSDSAFLCCNCDTKVHGANFLVARHVRHKICYKCKAFTTGGVCFSAGIVDKPISDVCASCLPEFRAGDYELDSLSSSSSACISSTESSSSAKKGNLDVGVKSIRATIGGSVSSTSSSGAAAVFSKYSASVLSAGEEVTLGMAGKIDVERKIKIIRSVRGARFSVESKAEGILIKWCRRLGLSSSSSSLVGRACHAFKAAVVLCGEYHQMKLGNMPMRAWLAASFWLSLRSVFMMMMIPREGEERSAAGSGKDYYWQVMMKRLEEISGISVKLILAAESKLILKMRKIRKQPRLHHPPKQQQQHMEEGWAEC